MHSDSLETPAREFPAPAFHFWPPEGFIPDHEDDTGVIHYRGPQARAYAASPIPGGMPSSADVGAYWRLRSRSLHAVTLELAVFERGGRETFSVEVSQAQAQALYVALGEVLERIPAAAALSEDALPSHGQVIVTDGRELPVYEPLEALIARRRELVSED